MAMSTEGLSLSLLWRLARPLALPLEGWELFGYFWCSSTMSAVSSRFERLFREPLLEEVSEGLWVGCGGRVGAASGAGESGEFEVLAEREGAVRRPERRVSLGERGGPMMAV